MTNKPRLTGTVKTLPYEPQPYPISLLTSSTGTRLFESLLLSPPIPIFHKIWSTYFEGKIGKLAIHPMSNFVVAKGVERLDKDGVERVVGECKAVSGGRQMISMFSFLGTVHWIGIKAEWQNPLGQVSYRQWWNEFLNWEIVSYPF